MPIQQMLLGISASGEQLPDIITTNLEQHIDFGFTSCYDQNTSYSAVSDLTTNANNMVVYYGSNPLTSSNSSELQVDTGTTPSHVNLGGNEQLDLRQTNDVWNNLGLGDYTLEFWLNIQQVNNYRSFIWLDITNHAGGRALFIQNGKMGQYGIFNHLNRTDFDTYSYYGTDNTLKGWEHLVFSRIGNGSNNFKFYRNNSLVFTDTDGNRSYTSSYFSSNDSNRFWGFTQNSGLNLFGKFAIHRFYRGKGLTASEVAYNWNAQKARFGL